jgi:hypothetical protein
VDRNLQKNISPFYQVENSNSVSFENGLRLQFQPKSGFDINSMKQKVDNKELFEIKVVKGKDFSPHDSIHHLIPTGLTLEREESQASLETLFGIMI